VSAAPSAFAKHSKNDKIAQLQKKLPQRCLVISLAILLPELENQTELIKPP